MVRELPSSESAYCKNSLSGPYLWWFQAITRLSVHVRDTSIYILIHISIYVLREYFRRLHEAKYGIVFSSINLSLFAHPNLVYTNAIWMLPFSNCTCLSCRNVTPEMGWNDSTHVSISRLLISSRDFIGFRENVSGTTNSFPGTCFATGMKRPRRISSPWHLNDVLSRSGVLISVTKGLWSV